MKEKQILLLLPKGCELLEAAAFTDVFGWDAVAGSKKTALLTAAYSSPLPLSFGHTMLPDMLWEQAQPKNFAAAVLPGGFPRYGYFHKNASAFLHSLLLEFHQQGKPLVAICNGALHLARAGLLQGGEAAIYNGEDGKWMEQLKQAGVSVKDADIVRWRNIITAKDPACAVSAALALLEMITDQNNAALIANMMGFTLPQIK